MTTFNSGNNKNIERLLSELAEEIHIPFEVIVAEAKGDLSPESHQKVARHIKNCSVCQEMLKDVEKSFTQQDTLDNSELSKNVPLDPRLSSKINLVAKVNSIRDELAERVAKLMLPEDSWFCIKPAISVYRKWLKQSQQFQTSKSEELPIAAFSGSADEEDDSFEGVVSAVKFADYVCDSCLEQCENREDIEHNLSMITKDATLIFDSHKLNNVTKENILKKTKELFKTI